MAKKQRKEPTPEPSSEDEPYDMEDDMMFESEEGEFEQMEGDGEMQIPHR